MNQLKEQVVAVFEGTNENFIDTLMFLKTDEQFLTKLEELGFSCIGGFVNLVITKNI